jgi:hypothetical protein
MAKKPAKKTYDYKPYPKYDGLRSGIKVSWHYYKSREDADAASVAAKHNAQIQWSLGYDFGYCSPGSIELVDESRGMPDKIGMYEVCIP